MRDQAGPRMIKIKPLLIWEICVMKKKDVLGWASREKIESALIPIRLKRIFECDELNY